jgi:hypothetical protein
MKIKNLIYDLLLEEVKNKKLLDYLSNKWFGENPTQEQRIESEKLYTEFQKIQNGLSTKRPQVISFLTRFDGNHGFSVFDPNNLRDITKYTLQQIRSLVDEYRDDDLDLGGDVFSGKDTKPTTERLDASKSLWEGDQNLIINEGGLRVYDIKDQKMSVKYGYYVENVNKDQGGTMPWCVTWRPDQPNRTNMWGHYRSQGRSFYFVIDTNKNPKKDRYYLGALQRVKSNTTGFILTSVLNDGDNTMSWDQIIGIYPQLKNYKELFIEKPYSQDELEEKNIVGQITERPGSQYEFRRMDRQLKKAYINNLGTLTLPESWQSMDEKLRALYITTTRENDITNKFSNLSFVNEIKKVGNEYTLLKNRLIALKKSPGFIIEHLMKNEFDIVMRNVANDNIKLLQSKNTRKYGLFDSLKNDWVKLNGVEYFVNYQKIDHKIVEDDNGTEYFLHVFSTSPEPNQQSFYCLYDSNSEVSSGQIQDSYFVSKNKWDDLIKSEKIIDDEMMATSKDVDLGTDSDIKEMFK